MWIPAGVVITEKVVPHRIRVVAAEPVAPVVSTASELRLSRLGINAAGVRLDPKIAAAEILKEAGYTDEQIESLKLARAVVQYEV